MPTIRTTIDDPTYAKLVTARKASGLPSVSALFLQRCDVLDESMEAIEIVRRAKALALKRPSKSRFRLRDLFPSATWEGFSKGARLRAGRLFFEMMGAAKDGVRPDQKSASGHQFYVKA
jgi:hypothetical protein